MQASSTHKNYCHYHQNHHHNHRHTHHPATYLSRCPPQPPSAQRSELGSPSSSASDPTLRHQSHRQHYDLPSQDMMIMIMMMTMVMMALIIYDSNIINDSHNYDDHDDDNYEIAVIMQDR